MLLFVASQHSSHDDVIKWIHFPRYWPFVRGIHRSPMNSPHKGQWRGALMFSLNCVLNKQSSDWWFETPSRSLWRDCNVVNINKPQWTTALPISHLWHISVRAQLRLLPPLRTFDCFYPQNILRINKIPDSHLLIPKCASRAIRSTLRLKIIGIKIGVRFEH